MVDIENIYHLKGGLDRKSLALKSIISYHNFEITAFSASIGKILIKMSQYPRQCEWAVNWRIAKQGFQLPNSTIMFDDERELFTASELIVFIPQDTTTDVIALRDWLHDGNNNAQGYQMIGCYETSADYQTRLIGLKFSFFCTIDAIFFCLHWSASPFVR